jgi:heat shock protein HslJ
MKTIFNASLAARPSGPLSRICDPVHLYQRCAGLLILLTLVGCDAPPSSLDRDAVRAAEIAGIEDSPVVLVEGRWEGAPYVEGGASRPTMGLVEEFLVRGEFVEPGREDVAVLVWHATGGTGNRLWLVILRSEVERPRSIAAQLVGDRVQVIHFAYFDGLLRLDLIAHGPRDAGCCPGQFERRDYRMVGDELVETTEVFGRVSTKDLAGEVWRLASLRRNDEPGLPFEVTIEFDRLGNAAGEAGCNSFAGDAVNTDGRNVSIRVQPNSARRCTGEALALEDEFMSRLGAVERFSFLNGRLLLQYAIEDEADALTFEPLRQ